MTPNHFYILDRTRTRPGAACVRIPRIYGIDLMAFCNTNFKVGVDFNVKMGYNTGMKKNSQKLDTLVVRVRSDQKSWVAEKAALAKIDTSKFIRVLIDSSMFTQLEIATNEK